MTGNNYMENWKNGEYEFVLSVNNLGFSNIRVKFKVNNSEILQDEPVLE